MGWFNDDFPGHEGYLVGLQRTPDAYPEWHDLGYKRLEPPAGERVHYVQVACDCGWRSPRLYAPLETDWVPSCVCAPQWFEDAALVLWREHIELEARRIQQQHAAVVGSSFILSLRRVGGTGGCVRT